MRYYTEPNTLSTRLCWRLVGFWWCVFGHVGLYHRRIGDSPIRLWPKPRMLHGKPAYNILAETIPDGAKVYRPWSITSLSAKIAKKKKKKKKFTLARSCAGRVETLFVSILPEKKKLANQTCSYVDNMCVTRHVRMTLLCGQAITVILKVQILLYTYNWYIIREIIWNWKVKLRWN